MKLATDLRHSALARGANSYKDPKWASAALVESWILLLRDSSAHEIEQAEIIINRLR